MTLTKFMSICLNIQMLDQIQIVVMESMETAAYDLWESSTPLQLLHQINETYGDLAVVGFIFFVDDQQHKSTFHIQLSEKSEKGETAYDQIK